MTTIPPWRKGQRVKQRKERAPTRPNSPVPEEQREQGKRVYRRNYLVNRLPPKVQARVFDWYARGVPYHKISERLAKLGHRIHPQALGRYWRHVWHGEHERLMEARGLLAVFKRAFQLEPKSRSATFAEEMLYTMLVNKLKDLEEKDPKELLEQARAQEKTEGREKKKGEKARQRSAVSEAKEVRRRWRELYGMDEDAEEEDKK